MDAHLEGFKHVSLLNVAYDGGAAFLAVDLDESRIVAIYEVTYEDVVCVVCTRKVVFDGVCS